MEKSRQIAVLVNRLQGKSNARILVFTGARQVGKTTLVKKMLPDFAYLNIEDPVQRKTYAALTAQQWQHLYPHAILDEVQKEPQLIESIKATYDTYTDIRYILLGSSQLLLLEKMKESLVGRCVIIEMYPLTLPELRTTTWQTDTPYSPWQALLRTPMDEPVFFPNFLLDPKNAEKAAAWAHYLRYGAYPALVQEAMDEDDRYEWLQNYIHTYLERDIRDLAAFRDLEPFIKLQRATAVYTGCVLNASNLARDIGITSKTIQRYIEYLKLSYQVIVLPAWERNTFKRLAKAPKIHMMDNGVLQAILQKRGGITEQEFESLVVAEIYKQAKNIRANVSFYHLRTQDGREVDLLVETQEGYFAFEIKMADHVSSADARHLVALEPLLDKPLLQGFILSNDPVNHHFYPKIQALHAAALLG